MASPKPRHVAFTKPTAHHVLKVAEEPVDGRGSRLLEESHPPVHVRFLGADLLRQGFLLRQDGLVLVVVVLAGVVGLLELAANVKAEAEDDHNEKDRGHQAEDDYWIFVMLVHGAALVGIARGSSEVRR